MAKYLTANLTLYDNAILHSTITEKTDNNRIPYNHERFRISKYEGVEWHQLSRNKAL